MAEKTTKKKTSKRVAAVPKDVAEGYTKPKVPAAPEAPTKAQRMDTVSTLPRAHSLSDLPAALQREPGDWSQAVQLVMARQLSVGRAKNRKQAKRAAKREWHDLWEAAGKPRV